MALLYLACLQALIYQSRQIIEVMRKKSLNFKVITVIGGLSNNRLYCQLLSDVCNLPVIVSNHGESLVLLGASILGASNYIEFKDLYFKKILEKFEGFDMSDTVILEPDSSTQEYHEKKYRIFLKMINDQKEYRQMMI